MPIPNTTNQTDNTVNPPAITTTNTNVANNDNKGKDDGLKLNCVHIKGGEKIKSQYSLSCKYCSKQVDGNNEIFKLNYKLSGTSSFYCSFCLRNGFHHQSKRKDILKFSLRNIHNYLASKAKHKTEAEKQAVLTGIVWCSDFSEYVGLKNPAFNYDRETLMWFIDFSKVGKGKNKIPLDEVKKTIMKILACHNIFASYDNYQASRYKNSVHLVKKIFEGIDKFHQTRYRPEGRPIMNVSPLPNAAIALNIDTE